MKFLVLVCCMVAAAAEAGRLDTAYLPPTGAGAGAGARSTAYAAILRQDQEINEQGFHYAYETSDGTKAEQQGRVVPGATQDAGSLAVQGSYSYVGTDGHTYSVSYTADENGFRAQGAHLPTPPPIPDAILKSLQLTAGGGGGGGASDDGQYQSSRSSYDADSGYRY